MGQDELADEFYKNKEASTGSGNAPKNEQWILEEKGGCSYYIKVPSDTDIEELRRKMIESHPDKKGGDHKKFILADLAYKEALKIRNENK